jgi:hypothetical protein
VEQPRDSENVDYAEANAESKAESTTERDSAARWLEEDAATLSRERASAEGTERPVDPAHDPAMEGGPGSMHETVDIATAAPDGSAIPDRGDFTGFTGLTGESIGGNSVGNLVTSRADEFGDGGALSGRGLGGVDFDPFTAGRQGEDERAGGEGGGDPEMDRIVMANDGSLMSAERKLKSMDDYVPPKNPLDKGDTTAPKGMKNFDDAAKPAKEDSTSIVDKGKEAWKDLKDFFGGSDDKTEMENPEGDTVNEEANLERVTVMQGSRGQPSGNPDDAGDDPTLDDNFIRPRDLVTNPGYEEAVADTTLTHSATLGSSPVTNPTDPALGDEGIITGGDYSGGGSGGSSGAGGDEVTPTSMAAGEGSTGSTGAVPDVTGVAPSTGGASALAGSKTDANGVQLDMATGQVIGSAAPAMGGELSSAGRGLAGQADPDDGGEDPDVQSMAGTDAALAMGGADAPMMSDSLSPQPHTGGVPPDDDPDAAFGPPGGEG